MVLAIGSYVGKFLVARCSVRSMKYVERPQINHPFSIRLRSPSAKAARSTGIEFKVLHLLHPFLTNAKCSIDPQRLSRNKEEYATGFDVLQAQLKIGKRRLNAFSVLMNKTPEEGEEEEPHQNGMLLLTPPGFKVILIKDDLPILSISGCPTRKEGITYLVLKQKFGVVVTLTETPLPPSWFRGLGCTSVHIPVIAGEVLSTDQGFGVFQAVVRAWRKKEGALIHCKHGQHRSAMAVASILMRVRHQTAEQAIHHLRDATTNPLCLSKKEDVDFLCRMQVVLQNCMKKKPTLKRERSKKNKPQLSTKKLRI